MQSWACHPMSVLCMSTETKKTCICSVSALPLPRVMYPSLGACFQKLVQSLHLLHPVCNLTLDLVGHSLIVICFGVPRHIFKILLSFIDLYNNLIKQALKLSLAAWLGFTLWYWAASLFWRFASISHPLSQPLLFDII